MPTMQFYVDEIKLALTGGVLELEIDDATIQKIAVCRRQTRAACPAGDSREAEKCWK